MPVYLRVNFSKDEETEPLYNNGLQTAHFPGSKAIIGNGRNAPKIRRNLLIDYEQQFYETEYKYVDDMPDFLAWTGFKSWKKVERQVTKKRTWQVNPARPNERLNESVETINIGSWSEPDIHDRGKTTWGWWVNEDTVDQWYSELPPIQVGIGTSIPLDRPNPALPSDYGQLSVDNSGSVGEELQPISSDPDVVAKVFGKQIEGQDSISITRDRKTSTFHVGDTISSDLLSALPGAVLQHSSKFKQDKNARAVITSITLDKKRLETSLPIDDTTEEVVSITYGEYLIGIQYQPIE